MRSNANGYHSLVVDATVPLSTISTALTTVSQFQKEISGVWYEPCNLDTSTTCPILYPIPYPG
jgi:hypothetical protein